MWDFETDPAFQTELDWVDAFVRNEVEPLDLVVRHGYDVTDPVRTPDDDIDVVQLDHHHRGGTGWAGTRRFPSAPTSWRPRWRTWRSAITATH